MYIPKMRDFIKDPKEEILGNQGFWAREASYHATRFFLVWFIFHLKGCLVVFSSLRGCWAVFSALRGCLGRILGLLGMIPCFDPTHYLEFETGFRLGTIVPPDPTRPDG